MKPALTILMAIAPVAASAGVSSAPLARAAPDAIRLRRVMAFIGISPRKSEFKRRKAKRASRKVHNLVGSLLASPGKIIVSRLSIYGAVGDLAEQTLPPLPRLTQSLFRADNEEASLTSCAASLQRAPPRPKLTQSGRPPESGPEA